MVPTPTTNHDNTLSVWKMYVYSVIINKINHFVYRLLSQAFVNSITEVNVNLNICRENVCVSTTTVKVIALSVKYYEYTDILPRVCRN